jgi:hypothetical protein
VSVFLPRDELAAVMGLPFVARFWVEPEVDAD